MTPALAAVALDRAARARDHGVVRVGHPLHGRDGELAWLRAAVDAVDERGSCLLVMGDPGSGKSALADAASDLGRERGMAVLATSGVASESHLPFAGLHQLLQPMLAHAGELPRSQRVALLGALGHIDVDLDDVMPVALAALNLLRDVATAAPVLVVAEDVHWIDRASAEVLAFVARRIESDPIVVLATARDLPSDALSGVRFDEVTLGRLDDDAAREIVRAHAPDLDPDLRDRLVDEAAGNALGLVELAVAWRRLPPGTLVASLVPVTTRLATTFASRVDTLPPACRALLLVTAVNEDDGLADVLAATSALGYGDLTADDLAPAAGARLIDVGARGIRFRHPLVRSTIHHRATAHDRRAAHAALAGVVGDPDRVAWHRAAAAVEPDEEVAAALERAAARARRRGAVPVAVTALERAADLSPDPARRGRRLVQAAHHADELGRQDVVRRLLDDAEPLALDPVDRARAAWRRQVLVDDAVGDAAQLGVLVGIVERMRDEGDVDMALESLTAVASTAWRMGVDARAGELIVRAATSLPVDEHDPRLINVLAQAAPVAQRAVVLTRLPTAARGAAGDPAGLGLLGNVAGIVGDQAAAARLLAAATRGLRAQGRLGTLTTTLVAEAWASWHLGDWGTTAAAAAEARRLGEQVDRPGSVIAARLVEAVLGASRGDVDGAVTTADEVGALARGVGAATIVALTDLVRSLASLAGGQPGAAYELLAPRFNAPTDDASAAVDMAMLPTFVDATVAIGRVAEGRAAVEAGERLADGCGSPTLDASLAYARPLGAGDADAEALYLSALDVALARWPFLRARLLVAYGTWLRRQRRTVESRVPLRAAREACDALGAGPWSERARQELRAAGESSPTRTIAAAERLTAQELEIARLAASGMTNREIGQQLYLSHRTVGSHLYHVFPKLGITSRGELPAALGDVSAVEAAG